VLRPWVKDRVVIYADTKMEWQIAAQAAFRQSCSVVTIYATLGPEVARCLLMTVAERVRETRQCV